MDVKLLVGNLCRRVEMSCIPQKGTLFELVIPDKDGKPGYAYCLDTIVKEIYRSLKDGKVTVDVELDADAPEKYLKQQRERQKKILTSADDWVKYIL